MERETKAEKSTQVELDRLYDAFSALVDATPRDEREAVLARLAVALAEELGDYNRVLRAVERAKQKW